MTLYRYTYHKWPPSVPLSSQRSLMFTMGDRMSRNEIRVKSSVLCVVACLAAAAPAHAQPPPYGAGAPGWNAPPDWVADLPADGGRTNLPPGITDIDAWLLSVRGEAIYRLRQRPARRCFTRAHGSRCLVRYTSRSVATGYDTTAHGARVYGWTW